MVLVSTQPERAMNRTLSTAALIAALFALSACNTVRGAGQDIEAGGEAISNTAEDVQSDL
jgi:entericidin B